MKWLSKRRSVRTYEDKKLDEDLKEKMNVLLSDLEKQYSGRYKFPFIELNLEGKIGTYGVIKGANAYIGGVLLKEGNLIELGYLFEKIIIYLTSLKLGTCWLGGTFKRGDFFKAMNLKEGERLLLTTPVGYVEEKMSLKEKSMRLIAQSDKRKDFDDLFFNENLDPLFLDELEEYLKALEMVRIGPSASNKQPWRIIKIDDNFNFYLARTPGYAKSLDYDIQLIDMGIAIYHFETSLKEMNIEGTWKELDNPKTYEGFEYICTWKKNI